MAINIPLIHISDLTEKKTISDSDYMLTGGTVPLISGKAVNLKPLLVELEWYLKGTGNIQFLKDNGVKIWDAWADENGELGPVYGYQWRHWPKNDGTNIDQISHRC